MMRPNLKNIVSGLLSIGGGLVGVVTLGCYYPSPEMRWLVWCTERDAKRRKRGGGAMNARQRRKHKRAHPDRYWTQEEIDEIAIKAAELKRLFGGAK